MIRVDSVVWPFVDLVFLSFRIAELTESQIADRFKCEKGAVK